MGEQRRVKRNIRLADDLMDALDEVATSQEKTRAALAREYIIAGLASHGATVAVEPSDTEKICRYLETREGEWATREEIAEATGVYEQMVTRILNGPFERRLLPPRGSGRRRVVWQLRGKGKEEIIEEGEVLKEPARPRGRPKKPPSEEPPKVKRPRGRPRKT